jgi:hypothetical protein
LSGGVSKKANLRKDYARFSIRCGSAEFVNFRVAAEKSDFGADVTANLQRRKAPASEGGRYTA